MYALGYSFGLRDWSRGAVYCTLAFTRPRVIKVASSQSHYIEVAQGDTDIFMYH